MFYYLLYPLRDTYFGFNVIRYITFRSIAAFITALIFTFILGPKFIKILANMKAVESVNQYAPDSHKTKTGTPTMGGLIILSGLLLSSFLWNIFTNKYIIYMYLVTFILGFIGFIDDYLKNFRHEKEGLVAKYKLFGQLAIALLIGLMIYFSPDKTLLTSISIPFLKNVYVQLGIFFVPLVIFLIVGSSNAVNLTDGLDGLAAGTVAIAAFAFAVISYLKGNFALAGYLNISYISDAAELTVFISALIGTLIGFLWFNTKPAQIFMGDTGSLALGGILAVISILLKEEILMGIVGGIFVMEAISSIIQRYYFKYWRVKTGTGKRFFLKAPLHHHFEMKGLKEEKIVARFWIVAILLAAVGLMTLKLR